MGINAAGEDMPFLFQAQSGLLEQGVKQALKGEHRIFDLAHVALIRKDNPDEGTFSIQAIIPVKQGALAGRPDEKLVAQAADELLKLTSGVATVKKVELKDTFNMRALKGGKQVVAELEPELGFV